MNTSIRRTMIRVAVAAALMPIAIGVAFAQTAPASAPAASTTALPSSPTGAALGPVDTYFVTQTSLGTPFQVDAGRLAATKGMTAAIRGYAQLMVSSHVTVNNALLAILKTKAPVPPPTLLSAAYATMISSLQHEHGRRFDADYLRGQLNYQRANVALYQYEIAHGTDAELKAFAQQTLPRIQDHLARVLKLEGGKTT
jgi:putative membrane protein